MKLTKGMQNVIIQWFFANLVFLIFFSSVLAFYVYPWVRKFEIMKDELLATSISLENTKKNVLSYGDFLATVWQGSLGSDIYYKNVLLYIDESFYSDHFQNKASLDAQTYLTELENKVVAEKKATDYIDKTKTINTILPFYTGNRNDDPQGINDLFFINYVENILYSFNLSATWDIGVGAMSKYQEKETINTLWTSPDTQTSEEPTAKNLLQEDIYTIPLSFSISGQKSDILDFLHFFENVGSLIQEGKDLKVHTDTVIKKVLDGNTTKPYNIYFNQVWVIDQVSLAEYPDSSTLPAKTNYTSLIDTLRQEQARDEYTISITLHFYVSGLPLYKVEQSLLTLQEDITALNQRVLKDQSIFASGVNAQGGENQKKVSFISSFHTTLLSLQSEVNLLQKSFSTEENSIYERVVTLQKRFEKMQEIYDTKMTTSLDN